MASESSDKDWLDLPLDVIANILSRIGLKDRLENAQKVCTTFRKVIKDPAMWRVVQMDNRWELKMCIHAIDLSEGQLVDISLMDYCNDELLLYIADRATQLKRLYISCLFDLHYSLPESLKKFPMLEELSLYLPKFSRETIEAAGRYCPRLKTLNVNQLCYLHNWEVVGDDGIAKAIGENLPYIRHLGLIYGNMSNIGLQVILDGCCHLESLDLRRCLTINLKGDLRKRCLEQIKYLRLPYDSIEDCPYLFRFMDTLFSRTFILSD